MQVMHNLAQDPLLVIIVPVEKRKESWICRTARGCTVADESCCVTYISPWKTQTTVFLLWLTPPESHMIFSTGRLSVLKDRTLYTLRVHLETASNAWNVFHRCPQSATACFTQEVIHFSQLNTSNQWCFSTGPQNWQNAKDYLYESMTEYIIN